jgi:hypothetical protein
MPETWLQVLAIIFGNAAIYLPIFFWLRTEANADRRDIASIIREMQVENKEFHTRLVLQDAEFKSHMIHFHEGRNRK